MILRMGSKTAIAILEWMHDRSFTRGDLEAHLKEIGFSDPYAKASLQSPIERIMQSVKRNGYASYENGAWQTRNDCVERAIAFHQKAPVEEADVSLRKLTDRARAIFGDRVTDEVIDNAIIEHGNNRRSGRSNDGEAFDMLGEVAKVQKIYDETDSIRAETAAIVKSNDLMRSKLEASEKETAEMNARLQAIKDETRQIQRETIEIQRETIEMLCGGKDERRTIN